MEIQEEKLIAYLGKNGLRYTRERKEVLACVSIMEGHFDSESIYIKLNSRGKKVSRASVYRALPLMVDSGMVREAFRDGSSVKYEYSDGKSHHDHMECVKCGKIIEFMNEEIEKLQEAVSGKYGFTLTGHHLKLRGICRDCTDASGPRLEGKV